MLRTIFNDFKQPSKFCLTKSYLKVNKTNKKLFASRQPLNLRNKIHIEVQTLKKLIFIIYVPEIISHPVKYEI